MRPAQPTPRHRPYVVPTSKVLIPPSELGKTRCRLALADTLAASFADAGRGAARGRPMGGRRMSGRLRGPRSATSGSNNRRTGKAYVRVCVCLCNPLIQPPPFSCVCVGGGCTQHTINLGCGIGNSQAPVRAVFVVWGRERFVCFAPH